MGPGSDAFLNPQGMAGVGVGAVAMGIKAAEEVGDGGGEE